MNDSNVTINCLEVNQPIGQFYIGVMKWMDLISIARKDIERIRREENGTIEGYFGIQRELSQKRLKEISQYVSYSDATFPSSIVISLQSTHFDPDSETVKENILDFKNNILTIRSDDKIAKIIDGQHRVFGLEKYARENPLFADQVNFDLIVTIFIDIDEEYESSIFATINKAQTKVNRSLVYDLYSLAKTRSPQRTCHNIVKLLNEEKGSAMYHLIKRLGKADFKSETITQATLADSILRFISLDPSKDRDLLRRGRKLELARGPMEKKLFLRNWFIKKEDEKIAQIIWNYFAALKAKWPVAWGNPDRILTKSTGIIAVMRLLANIARKFESGTVISENDFSGILSSINLTDDDFINDQYKAGGVGQSDLYKDLLSDIIDH